MSSVLEAPNKPVLTPEDLLRLEDVDRYELVDGQVVEKSMGFRSGRIASQLSAQLVAFCNAEKLGWVVSEVGFQCFSDGKTRRPDIAYIQLSRLAADQEPEGNCSLSPDLAVEVISPNDLFGEVVEKVEKYLQAGVKLVWVVDTFTDKINVYRPDGRGEILTTDDELSGKEVLPGFRCSIRELFQSPVGSPS